MCCFLSLLNSALFISPKYIPPCNSNIEKFFDIVKAKKR